MLAGDYSDPVPERVPAGVMASRTRHKPRHRWAEVLCADRSWQPCEVLAWAKDEGGGWVALVQWPDRSQDWLVYESSLIQPAPPGPLKA